MKNRFKYFTVASRIFWALLLFFLLFYITPFHEIFFKEEGVADEIVNRGKEIKEDSASLPVPPQPEDVKNFVWEWDCAFSTRHYKMNFSVLNKGIAASEQLRKSVAEFYSWEQVYANLATHDMAVLESMITSYKELAKAKQLNYMECMQMVISSIQAIPYTFVLPGESSCGDFLNQIPPDDCRAKPFPYGCCDGVNKGIYAPVEFVVKRTGDCDTRSLLAYTILKNMGYDVAVMVSYEEEHSVLGVNVPQQQGDGKRGNKGEANRYFLWELTAYGPVLGQRIDGNDWFIALK
jgi:hypothetical protein